MSKVTAYLDCGCAILEGGVRVRCPSCEAALEFSQATLVATDKLENQNEALYTLVQERDKAEAEAWNALSRYKFQMFGYWASIWVHLNRISGLHSPNPFGELVGLARTRRKDTLTTAKPHESSWNV